MVKIPSHFFFSSLFRDRIKQMKILYYALNLELYKICTKIVQDKFQLVMSFPGTGLCLYWTLGICTKIISRSQMSLVHKHYHFKYCHLLSQWLYISIAWGGAFLLQLEIALLVSYLFVVFKDCFIVRVIFNIFYSWGGSCYMSKSKLRNHSDPPPFLSRMNCKPHIFFYCQFLFIYSLAVCFSSLMIEYEKCISVWLLLFIKFPILCRMSF